MVSQHQSKDSGSKKNEGKELGMVAPQDKSSKKMKFASSSAETEPTSQTTISDDSKTGRGMSTMPRVVKRKLQKLRPIVEYNKMGKGIGQAHSEMQSYIGVLAHSRVPLVDKKWSQIPKDIKEQIWEAVDMAFVVGQGGKNSVLSSAAKKWKDFKSTLSHPGPAPPVVTPRTGSAVAQYCPLWAWLHSHQPARFCFWELTKQLPRVVTHPGIAPASNSLNFGVPTNPKPVSSQKASPRSEWRSGLDLTLPSMILSSLGLATFSPALKDLFLGAHGATSQGVTHPGIAPASNSLNFGVLTTPQPVSSQKASRYEDARNSEVKRVGGWSNPRMGDHPGKLLRELPGTKPCGLIREKLEYNHRLSRKGYAGLEDQLEETMPGVETDRSTLWKRARQDKHGNIPNPKVAEKAKLIDELQKQVSEGKVSVYGSNDVLTMALGPEHPGRVRAVGSGISPRQYFNLPKPQRVSFDDRLKDSLRVLFQEETKKMEAKAREEALRMEARTKQLVEAEREHFLSQLSQLIPNFDPSMLKPRISQSPKNPMSDKASCSGGDGKHQEEEKKDTAKNGKHQEDEEKEEEKKEEEKEEEKEKEDEEKHDDKVIEVGDYLNVEAPSFLKTLCRYVETTLMPEEKILQFTIDKEVFGRERDTFLLPEDITQFAGMEEIGATVVAVYMSMVGFIDPATVSANSGTIADRSRLVASRLQKTDGEQIFMMPYNPGLVSLTGFCFYDFQ
ncbi:hypothetical protein L3X38_015817 [Prunus dulcis]|uniref:Uncharacterized protein n=1 Tax=Prunus dulcis TaxID=3755 RepID=A0AAD4Z8K9_PRUDU|nr:hypothetical protein L3X38_015817 [Prunus dulcis]